MKLTKTFKRFWNMQKHTGGFTLVELIVVIAILAILAGVAIPAYSGYITKAKEAGDSQLLAAVNRAFTAACMEQGIAMSTLDNTTAKMPLADGKVNTNAILPTNVQSGFATYFAGNEDIAFETYAALYFDTTKGAFAPVVSNSAYAGLAGLLSGADKTALLNSIFMNKDAGMGIDGLLNKVNDVTGFAALMGDSGAMAQVLNSSEFMSFAGSALGLDPAEPGFQDEMNAKFGTLVADMMEKNPGMTPEEAQNQIRANAAVLYAAENTAGMSVSSVVDLLGTDGAKDTIKNNLDPNSGDSGLALSQAAVAYGMYTAYAYSTGDQALIDSTNDPLAILNGLDDDGFQAYINDTNNHTDIQAYIDSMGMVSTVSQDGTAVDELMVNGFNDPALAAMLNQMIGG